MMGCLFYSFPMICRDAIHRVHSSRLLTSMTCRGGEDGGRGHNDFLRVACILLGLLTLFITSCGAQQTSQPDPRLKAFHVLSARIIMLDTQAEVDGTLQNSNRSDRFPYDVTIIATFYNSAGNIVGQAGGVAEDVYPGMVRPFTLVGQVDSTQYSHMVVTVVSLKERRIEKLIPTPSIVP